MPTYVTQYPSLQLFLTLKFFQIRMFNSAFTEAGCTGIIEQWCSNSETYTRCCGVCAYVRIRFLAL